MGWNVWSWWWLWALFMVFLLIPTGYGWGYRGWGPPYPSYYRQRRGFAATHPSAAWGWFADVLWICFAVELVWLMTVGIHWGR
jgi:hypothetical protein